MHHEIIKRPRTNSPSLLNLNPLNPIPINKASNLQLLIPLAGQFILLLILILLLALLNHNLFLLFFLLNLLLVLHINIKPIILVVFLFLDQFVDGEQTFV